MKTRFLLVLAATSAFFSTLSGVIIAPANAGPIAAPTATSNVAVVVTVPEVLYLRTVSEIDVNLTASELATTPTALTASGNGLSAFDQSLTASATSGGVDSTNPFVNNGTNIQVSQNIPKVYAVWSNSAAGTVAISATVKTGTFTTGSTNKPTLTSVVSTNSSETASLTSPGIGGVTLNLDIPGNSAAGQYSGASIDITATNN